MNYKPVKYFFSSACGNCSLTWQQDEVQTGPWGWLVGRYAVCMERGAVTWSQALFLGHVPNTVPKMGRTLWLCSTPNVSGSFCPSRWARTAQLGAGERAQAGSGRERHSWQFCSAQGEQCQTTHALLASPLTTSARQEPFLWSQWHLINIKLMWIKGNWDIYVSIPLYRWVWFYFCSHWFDIDTAPLAFMTWISV